MCVYIHTYTQISIVILECMRTLYKKTPAAGPINPSVACTTDKLFSVAVVLPSRTARQHHASMCHVPRTCPPTNVIPIPCHHQWYSNSSTAHIFTLRV